MGESFSGGAERGAEHNVGPGSMDRIRLWGAEIARLQSLQLRELAAYREQYGDAREVAAELALTLSIGEQAARKQVDLANALVSRLPNTLMAMERGTIDSYKASKIAEPTAWLSDEKAREVDTMMADRVEGRGPGWIRRAANRAVYRVDPNGAEERARLRRTERRVELLHGDDGMATLLADLPAEVASAAYARIDRHARALRGRGETRTTDQLRADVLADLLLGTGTVGTAPGKAEVFVYVDLCTLMGLRDEPAELAGHGPIPAWVAREIAFDPHSTWRRIITDPHTGAPIDVGRQRYRPPAVTDDHVRVRDRTCRFPGCHRPSQHSDLDHATDWNHHGHTKPDNLIGLCRRHHRLKGVPGWAYRLDQATHRLTVRTPSGHTHTSTPEPLHDPTPAPF